MFFCRPLCERREIWKKKRPVYWNLYFSGAVRIRENFSIFVGEVGSFSESQCPAVRKLSICDCEFTMLPTPVLRTINRKQANLCNIQADQVIGKFWRNQNILTTLPSASVYRLFRLWIKTPCLCWKILIYLRARAFVIARARHHSSVINDNMA